MYKTKRKKKRLTEATPSGATIYHYAHVSGAGGRLKKNFVEKIADEVSQFHLSESDTDDTAETKNIVKKRPTTKCSLDEQGEHYPIELWMHISLHIYPEDVGRFAAICRTTYNVVNYSNFWFNLYRRFYRKTDGIPEILQPHRMVRKYGLRALVIRGLYYVYPPFVVKLKKWYPETLSDLAGRVCTGASIEKCTGSNQWLFSFKLLERHLDNRGRSMASRKSSSAENVGDINVNDDEGCKMLQIWTKHYCPIPMLTGLVLNSASRNISRDVRFERITMVFRDGPTTYSSNTVAIENIERVSIMNWWHPSFPHSKLNYHNFYQDTLMNNCLE